MKIYWYLRKCTWPKVGSNVLLKFKLMDLFKGFGKKEKPSFTFDIDINLDEFDFERNALMESVFEILKKYHIRQKSTFDNHVKIMVRDFQEMFNKESSRMYKSCLELAAINYYFFVQKFQLNKIDPSVAQAYFTTIFHNFDNFNTIVKESNYRSLRDFLSTKASYMHAALNNLEGFGFFSYYYDILVLKPVIKGDPLDFEISELDASKIARICDYIPGLIEDISKQADHLIKEIK